MSKFNGNSDDNSQLFDGTLDIYVNSIKSGGLTPGLPLKTDSSRSFVSEKIQLTDINAVLATNPFSGTLTVTDLETDDTFSLNGELQKIDNFTTSTATDTNITGIIKVPEIATGRVYDSTQATWITLDATDITISATDFLVNGNNLPDQINAVETKTQNITATANVTSLTGHLFVPTANITNTVDAKNYKENGVSGLLLKNDKTETLYVGIDAARNQTTGSRNLYIGKSAGRNNLIGTDNFGIGPSALYSNLASHNLGIGRSAIERNTTGSLNTAVGSFSQLGGGGGPNTASLNTSVGYATLQGITSGSSNTAVGAQCGNNISSGFNNALLGTAAGFGLTTGQQNTIIGCQAENNDNPIRCVALGADTDVGSNTNSIAIGFQASCFNNNQVVIGNSSITQTILKGVVNCQDMSVVTLGATNATFTTMTAPTANFDTVTATNSASINGATLSVANDTLIATINSIPYPIAGGSLSIKVDLTTAGGIYSIGGDIAIRWTAAGNQMQYIDNSSLTNPYSFTMSYNHNTSGVADLKYISGKSAYSGWRYFTPSGVNRDSEFDLASAGGRYDFTLIADDDTKPSYIGSLFHSDITVKGAFKIEVIN
jgi:hypothetical protein